MRKRTCWQTGKLRYCFSILLIIKKSLRHSRVVSLWRSGPCGLMSGCEITKLFQKDLETSGIQKPLKLRAYTVVVGMKVTP